MMRSQREVKALSTACGKLLVATNSNWGGAVTVTGWCQLRVASSFLL